MISIAQVDPREPAVAELLRRHQEFCGTSGSCENNYVLGLDELTDPAISVFAVRDGDQVLGVGALRDLGDGHAELKSMHTAAAARGRGVGRLMVRHLIQVARDHGQARVSLETGTLPEFAAARALYLAEGFAPTGPFSSYRPSPENTFMTLALS